MSVAEAAKAHFEVQKNSRLEVPEWGADGTPLVIFYDPPTLRDLHTLTEKAGGNVERAVCELIVRNARDANGDRLFEARDAATLYADADPNVVSRIGIQMRAHLSVEEQEKN